MKSWKLVVFLFNFVVLLLAPTGGLIIDAILKGDRYGESEPLRLCKPFTKNAYEAVTVVSPKAQRPCLSGTPIWYWDFGSLEMNEIKDGTEYHTLIQITGGPDTDSDPGITNSLEERDNLFYGTLNRDSIFRSLFKIKREGRYLHLNDEDDLKAGDVLEFWGPAGSGSKKLFLTAFGPDSFGIRRVPYSDDPAVPLDLEVELRVRVASSSNTKNGSRSERERLSGQSPVNRSTSLSPRKNKKPGCLSRVCKATATGISNLLQGARNIFSNSGAPSSHRASKSRSQDPRRFLDDLTFADNDRSGTGSMRLRDSLSRQQTQNSEPSARSANPRRQSNRGEAFESLTAADEEGTLPALPRLLNLGPLGLQRLLRFAGNSELPRITEGTEGTGIDTHAEIRTPGLVDTRPILNTMTTSRPDTHGHFGSEVLVSPKNPEIAENPEEEEDEEDEDEIDEEEKEEDTSSLSITISEDIGEDEDIEVNNPPMLLTREGGPGASKGALDLSRLTSTYVSQPIPVEKQLRRSKNIIETYSGDLE
ncbi:hypothetical protein TWF718_010466 [Orbilia javanica]|uniref:Uncharacterized protein n=1 Tax=Orbilia javanica TaxID=47235 RepID=A0AAN8RB36_9PEZI